MNARLLEKLVAYREARGLATAKILLEQKIRYQFSILNNTKGSAEFRKEFTKANTMQELLLIEARAAREYWKRFGESISSRVVWESRRPHAEDPCNKLLDVGYHYLTQRIMRMCVELNIPTELGLFHRAQSANAHPLVYDLIEWLRPLLVDKTIQIFFMKKKKRVERITERDIRHILAVIKKRFEQRYYHKRLGYCITLAYWKKIILLEFEKCIRDNKLFRPIFPSLRHETRCKRNRPALQAQGDEIAVT